MLRDYLIICMELYFSYTWNASNSSSYRLFPLFIVAINSRNSLKSNVPLLSMSDFCSISSISIGSAFRFEQRSTAIDISSREMEPSLLISVFDVQN